MPGFDMRSLCRAVSCLLGVHPTAVMQLYVITGVPD